MQKSKFDILHHLISIDQKGSLQKIVEKHTEELKKVEEDLQAKIIDGEKGASSEIDSHKNKTEELQKVRIQH